MYSFNNRQYLFKQSSGKIWDFYFDEKSGLCHTLLTKRNNWSEPVVLQKNANKYFFADIDYEDNFHIMFQDSHGDIYYSLLDSANNLKTIPILNSKSQSLYNKHMFLAPFKNSVHFFFVLQYNDSPILAHQLLVNNVLSNPKVIDYVAKNGMPYSIACDRSNNIYAFYQSSDGKYIQTGYKKFIPSQKTWSEFTPVTKYTGDSEYARTLIDNRNILHICYQRRSAKQYELVYRQKLPDSNVFTDENIIHSSAYPFEDSSIVCINENVIVYWVREDVIYYGSSFDGGNTWNKPAKYNFPYSRQLSCLVYKTNNPYENGKITVREIPGAFINGVKLAFYQDVSENINNLTAEELRNLIVDSLKMLKNSIEELKEFNVNIREDHSKIVSNMQSNEKDIIKNTVRVNTVENEVSMLKNETEVLKSEVEMLKNGVYNNKKLPE